MVRPSDRLLLLTAAGVLVVFAYGLLALLRLGADLGATTPPYSSYRSDPIGMKALYESLGRLPGLRVERNMERPERLHGGAGDTILLAGVRVYGDIDQVEKPVVEALERLASAGARVVLAFAPEPVGPGTTAGRDRLEEFIKETRPQRDDDDGDEDIRKGGGARETPIAERPADDGGESEDTDEDAAPWERLETVSLKGRWGVVCRYVDLEHSMDYDLALEYRPAKAMRTGGAGGVGPLPESIPWHTALCFETTDAAWRTLYSRDGSPVLVERAYGAGAIVISADSYFLSNEALLNDRYSTLISWLVGPADRVVFDEWLKGMERSPGVMGLIRQYGLHTTLGGLMLVALLFVWLRATPLVPPPEPRWADATTVAGRDTAQGLANLLQRNVPRAELLRTACDQWLRECPERASDRAAQLRKAVESASRAPEPRRWTDAEIVRRYNELARLVGERKTTPAVAAGADTPMPGTSNEGTD